MDCCLLHELLLNPSLSLLFLLLELLLHTLLVKLALLLLALLLLPHRRNRHADTCLPQTPPYNHLHGLPRR